MAQPTNIEWTEQSWNFLRGCRRISEGCGSDRGGGCYAERQAIRHAGPGGPYEGLVKSTPRGPRWTGEISFHEDILLEPLKRKKPTTYFVNSMSDLFHEKVTDEMLDKAFAVMALTPQHTYQILTKRPERMKAYLSGTNFKGRVHDVMSAMTGPVPMHVWEQRLDAIASFPNVWLGVSVEDQKTADERIPLLLETPAAVRWISAEPLLEQVDLERYLYTRYLHGGPYHEYNRLDWVVTGGESGPNARSCDLRHIRLIVRDCRLAGVPVFVKQLGGNLSDQDLSECQRSSGRSVHDKKGGDPDEWPDDLKVRKFPTVENSLPAH